MKMSGGREGGLFRILKLGFSGKVGLVSELKRAGQGWGKGTSLLDFR